MNLPDFNNISAAEQKQFFAEYGFIGPIRAISTHEAKEIEVELRQALVEGDYGSVSRRNRHFDLDSLKRLTILPQFLETVKNVYDENLVLWRSHVFTGRRKRGLGWHQDFFTSFLANPRNHCTVHFAVTEATPDNCVMVIPGSHKWTEEDIRAKGLELIEETSSGYGTPYYMKRNAIKHVSMTLKPGEYFVFHPGTMHASSDRLHEKGTKSGLVGSLKRMAKALLAKLASRGIGTMGSRLAVGFRFCDANNTINDAAFVETAELGHRAVIVAGSMKCPANFDDWRLQKLAS